MTEHPARRDALEPPARRDGVQPTERRDAVEAVTWPVRVATAWAWRLLVLGFAVEQIAQVFLTIELVAFSFVLALFLTAVLHPLERALRRIPGPRSVSAGLALLVGVTALAAIGTFVTWQITMHSTQLGDQITKLVEQVRDWLRTGPLHLNSADLNKISDNITKAIKDNQSQLISGAIATVRTVAEALGALLLILLSTFFLLRDGDQIWRWTVRLFPQGSHERLDVAGRVGWRTLGGYMRGQVLIAMFHGVSITVLLLVLQIPLAAALGVLIFLGSFVPLIGLTVTGTLCVAVALLEHGVGAAIIVGVAIIVLVQLEAHLLQPVIMSRSVEVHPLAIALAVLTGTILAGIVGALLAVPFVAFLNSTIHALRQTSDVPDGDAGFPVQGKESPRGDAVDLAKLPDDARPPMTSEPPSASDDPPPAEADDPPPAEAETKPSRPDGSAQRASH